MLPRRIIYATNATPITGAGHLRRCIEIAKVMPKSIEAHIFGSIEIPWLKRLSTEVFVEADYPDLYGNEDLIIVDSYEKEFCSQVDLRYPNSHLIQFADRYTPLIDRARLVFLDLPFVKENLDDQLRTIAHGIEYLPVKRLRTKKREFQNKAKRVVITTGGVVNEEIFFQLHGELTRSIYKDIHFEFIGFPKTLPIDRENLRFTKLGNGLAKKIDYCDTAISSAGSTMWDMLANELILGLVALVDNQMANLEFAINSHQCVSIFEPKTLVLNVDNLKTLLFDQDFRSLFYNRINGKYDFDGAKRTSMKILKDFEDFFQKQFPRC